MELDENCDARVADYVSYIKPGFAERAAEIISALSSPPILAVAGIIVGAETINQDYARIWTAAFITLSIIPPILYVLWLVRRGGASNFHLDVRSHRTRPLLAILGNSALVWMIFLIAGAPELLLAIAAAGFAAVGLILAVTMIWKISGHAASAGGITATVCVLFGQDALFAAGIVPVVAWSRIQLGKHTLAQTLAGAALGGAIFTAALYIAEI
ncbi:MAG: hypothetical protein ACT4NX_07210 [Deltaproteobacteria bacterium]